MTADNIISLEEVEYLWDHSSYGPRASLFLKKHFNSGKPWSEFDKVRYEQLCEEEKDWTLKDWGTYQVQPHYDL